MVKNGEKMKEISQSLRNVWGRGDLIFL